MQSLSVNRILFLIFLFGMAIRIWSIWPGNTIVGFDQARDFFAAKEILNGDIKIIGPTAGNNPNLHHGVLYWYFLIPPLLIGGNPALIAIWNSFFNAAAAIVLFLIAETLFKNRRVGYIAALIASTSYYYVEFSGWLSNPTVTLLTVPLFFLGLLKYWRGKAWGLPFSLFFLGATIQFELFFIYLIPVFLLSFLVLRLRLPTLRIFLLSLLTFALSLSTMIATEIKFGFGGIKSILGAGKLVGAGGLSFWELTKSFLEKRWETFYLNFWPQEEFLGSLLGILAM